MRQLVRQVHLWLGLGLGGLFALLGLTGALLAFYPQVDALLHPEIRVESQSPALPDWDQALKTLRISYPDKQGPWRFEVRENSAPIVARYQNPAERAQYDFRPMMVWLSADGTQILRRDYWGEYFVTFIYDLHFRLTLGETAGEILGWTGFALLGLVLTGLWAWWPRGSWRKAVRVKFHASPQRTLRDVHKLLGLSAILFLLLLTVTGIMLELPKASDAALNGMGLKVETMPRPAPVADAGVHVSVAQAVAIARKALPEARLAGIETPPASGGLYKFRLQVAGDPSARFPHSFVWVESHSGAVRAVLDGRTAAPGNQVNAWVHPLHDGSALGLAGRVLVSLVGLIPLALLITGWMRWRGRRAGGMKGRA